MSLTHLQKQIEILTDEINDIFHATQLNFDAIKIHLQIEDQSIKKDFKYPQAQPSQIKPTITNCQNEFKSLKNAYQERTNLRLQYLINQQIKSEQQKVRRQRLLEYEDKIYDHRRLICDKESFYDSLIKPKFKRPAGMTVQQFQEFKMKEAQNEERENFRQLEEETQILLKMEKFLRNYRLSLQEEFTKYQNMVQAQSNKKKDNTKELQKNQEGKQSQRRQQNQKYQKQGNEEKPLIKDNQLTKEEQKQKVINILNTTPTLYSKFQNLQMTKLTPQAFEESKKLLQQCLGLSETEAQLQKQYKEQREMYKYLKWQQTDLIKKYKKIQDQIKELRSINHAQNKRKPSF